MNAFKVGGWCVGALVGVCFVSGMVLVNMPVKAATEAVDNISLTVPPACTMESTIDTPHSATVTSGTYKSDIGVTTMTVYCNDDNGYAVYAVGYSADEYGNTKMLSGTNIINTGTATSGDNSAWAMKITPVAGAYAPTIENGFGSYSSVPATYTKVASFASATDDATGSSFKSTYATYVSSSQYTGTYTGKVKYTFVHPANTAAPLPGLLGIANMQQMTPEICAESTVGDEKQLIDSRDSKSYWVAKLADGKCWMTQNLDHDISTTFAYTPDNTDIPANWTPDKSTYATGTTTWDTSSTTGYNIQQSYDPGDKIWDGTLDSNYSTNLSNMAQGTDQHYHLGNYYNWGAAVAMNDTSAYTTQYQDVNQSICPKGWMLPKSGNITTAGSFQHLVNQYNWASNQMTNPNIWQAPLYFPLSGIWNGSSYNVASNGYFWSSVVHSSNYAYHLYEGYNGDVSPVDDYRRYWGYSVRCVSR